jgi:hypothetical protein
MTANKSHKNPTQRQFQLIRISAQFLPDFKNRLSTLIVLIDKCRKFNIVKYERGGRPTLKVELRKLPVV